MNESKPSEETLFATLVQLPEPQRSTALRDACGQDAALRQRLEMLLAAHDRASGFMARPVGPSVPKSAGLTIPLAERLGDQIGPYKLTQQIGEGGCGVVYMAQQEAPVRRLVALKVIKLGMDTRQVVARFEAERQALALMDHPNIAKVLDAGATETGRPFFVMELVRGIKITDYCDQNLLSTTERLQLFVEVCRAVQHAHQKGIIHRDLKPSNILVAINDGVPVPKVIDFGIAKATQGRLTDMTLVTAFDQFIGTPAYVSPEQAVLTSLDIDTRSDIYSLGVLLYELLTGKTPFDTQQLLAAGLDELRRTIREQAPMRPSTRLNGLAQGEITAVAKARRIEPRKLTGLLRGDLDWIVMKCLEKDRTRRYETANGLARDVERHLGNEPVTARPPSHLYEFQRTLRRHWVGFSAVSAVLTVLGVGVVVSTSEAVRAHRAEVEQGRQKAVAQQFLYRSLLGEARATRSARQPGYRDQVFSLLSHAKALDVPEKNLGKLRQEAVACLGDFLGLTPVGLTDFALRIVNDYLDPTGNIAAFELWDGSIQLRQFPSGRELARFDLTNEFLQDFCFDPQGSRFLANYGSNSSSLYTWQPDANGHWLQTDNRSLPPFTIRLLNSRSGIFGVNVSPLGRPFPFTLQKQTVRKIFEFRPPGPSESQSRSLEFRLLNAQTGEFISGCVVTNIVPRNGELTFYVSREPQVLAVETWEPSPNAAVRLHDASTPVQNDSQNSLDLVKHVPTKAENEGQNSMSMVNVYHWTTGRLIAQFQRRINGSLEASAPLFFSENGQYVISLTELGGVIYSLPNLEHLAQFPGPYYGKAPRICGDKVAVPEANRLLLYSLRRREEIALLDVAEDTRPADFSADGNSLLVSGGQHAWLYRLITPEKLDLPLHGGAVAGAAFSPDGLRLATVGKDRVVRVCDALTGAILWETNNLPGLGQCISYSPDGNWLAIGVWDKDLVTILDAQTGRWMLGLGTGLSGKTTYCIQFSPDGRFLAVGADVTRVWTVSSPTNGVFAARLFKSWNGAAMDPTFSPNSQLLAFCSLYNDYEDPPSNWGPFSRPMYVWDFPRSDLPRPLAWRIVGGIECERFSPDGHQLLALDTSGDFVSVEVATGKRAAAIHARDPQFTQLSVGGQLSPDGSKVALAITPPSGGAVSILDPKTGNLLYSLPAETGTIYWLTWSPDCRRLAVARDNGKTSIWNLEEVGQVLAKLGLGP